MSYKIKARKFISFNGGRGQSVPHKFHEPYYHRPIMSELFINMKESGAYFNMKS